MITGGQLRLSRPNGSPVLFVHGSNVDCRIWDEHAEIIGSRYRLVAPTQRYFGLLLWPDDGRDFSIQTHAADLAAFIGESNLAPATIVDRGNFENAVQLFMDGVNENVGTFRSLPPKVRQIMLENARMLPLLFAAPPPQITCADLSGLSVPVTVAFGEDSRAFYRIAAQWAARCIPGARLITIPKARHLWPIENPGEFSQVVLDFLETVNACV